MKRNITTLSAMLLVCTVSCGLAWGQATAQIHGVVQDSSGAAVPGAEVKATQTDTGTVRTVNSEADGSYVIFVSSHAQAVNWLPAPPAGAFSITLRLYNPDAAVYRNLASVNLPTIARGDCR